jgi:excisionase family DNA binding protein
MAMKDEAFLTTEEVLEYLQVNLRTVYRLIKAGKIPAVRVGRQWRFRKADIDAWLTSQPTSSPSGPALPSTPRSPAETHTGTRPRVLIVDDEASIRDLLSKTLALADYEVDVAPDGQEALDRLKTQAYDLLITDLRMPGLDGMSVINEARRLHPRLPAIVITGFSTEATAIDAANIGVSGYLTKPFKVPKILEVAARALGE